MQVSSWPAGTVPPSFNLLWGIVSHWDVSLRRMTAKWSLFSGGESNSQSFMKYLFKSPFYLISYKLDCQGTQISCSAWMTLVFDQQQVWLTEVAWIWVSVFMGLIS